MEIMVIIVVMVMAIISTIVVTIIVIITITIVVIEISSIRELYFKILDCEFNFRLAVDVFRQ